MQLNYTFQYYHQYSPSSSPVLVLILVVVVPGNTVTDKSLCSLPEGEIVNLQASV